MSLDVKLQYWIEYGAALIHGYMYEELGLYDFDESVFDSVWNKYISSSSMQNWMPLLDSGFSSGIIFQNKKEGRYNHYIGVKSSVNFMFSNNMKPQTVPHPKERYSW